jgi:hypothetical protein
LRGVSKDGAELPWFDTRGFAAFLTMRATALLWSSAKLVS